MTLATAGADGPVSVSKRSNELTIVDDADVVAATTAATAPTPSRPKVPPPPLPVPAPRLLQVLKLYVVWAAG